MGDMADYDIQEGMDMWAAHTGHSCLQDCRYCEEEDEDLDEGDKKGESS